MAKLSTLNLHANCALKPHNPPAPRAYTVHLQSLSKNTMGLCLNYSSSGKSSNLKVPEWAEVALFSGRSENALQTCATNMRYVTTLTFPVGLVYKQLWSSYLWALGTSDSRTGATVKPSVSQRLTFSCLCFSDKQKNTHSVTLTQIRQAGTNTHAKHTLYCVWFATHDRTFLFAHIVIQRGRNV